MSMGGMKACHPIPAIYDWDIEHCSIPPPLACKGNRKWISFSESEHLAHGGWNLPFSCPGNLSKSDMIDPIFGLCHLLLSKFFPSISLS